MVKFHKGKEFTYYLTFSGTNFYELMDIVKHYNSDYNKKVIMLNGEEIEHAWSIDTTLADKMILELLNIENFEVPTFISEIAGKRSKGDFKKFRATIDPKLVMSDFKGDYQKQAIAKGISQNRLALFHEMGLGKSFEIQTIINHLYAWGKVKRYVIVSPPEGVINLAKECIRFSSFNLTWDDIYIVNTDNRNPFENPKTLTIMTYRNLIMLHEDFYFKKNKKKAPKRILKNYIPWEIMGKDSALILDESPAIKNPKSKTSKIMEKTKSYFEYRYIMTGTPAPKYSQDLYTQFKFLNTASVPKTFSNFLGEIANIGNRFSPVAVNYYYPDKVQGFLNSVDYLVDRAKTKGNIELPELIVDPIYCKLPQAQASIYQEISKNTLARIKEENGRITSSTLHAKYPYLVLALHDPMVVSIDKLDENRTSKGLLHKLAKWNIQDNGKFEVCQSLLNRNKEQGKKTILWSGHPLIIDELANKFSKFKPYTLHAGTVVNKGESVAERNDSVVSAFKEDKDSWLLIANYSCLKTSVNITEASRQIYWDRSWDAETYAQTIKRSHRIGQDETVIINPLIFSNTLEEKQETELNSRLDFNASVWAGDKKVDDYSEYDDEFSPELVYALKELRERL